MQIAWVCCGYSTTKNKKAVALLPSLAKQSFNHLILDLQTGKKNKRGENFHLILDLQTFKGTSERLLQRAPVMKERICKWLRYCIQTQPIATVLGASTPYTDKTFIPAGTRAISAPFAVMAKDPKISFLTAVNAAFTTPGSTDCLSIGRASIIEYF